MQILIGYKGFVQAKKVALHNESLLGARIALKPALTYHPAQGFGQDIFTSLTTRKAQVACSYCGMAHAIKNKNMKQAITQSGEDQMAAGIGATTSSSTLRAIGKPKYLPRPDTIRLKSDGDATSTVPLQARRNVAASEKVLNPARSSTPVESTTTAPLTPQTPSRVNGYSSPFKSERRLNDDNDKSICY